jgi:hypothetical protein
VFDETFPAIREQLYEGYGAIELMASGQSCFAEAEAILDRYSRAQVRAYERQFLLIMDVMGQRGQVSWIFATNLL